jgi:hypothetical protein
MPSLAWNGSDLCKLSGQSNFDPTLGWTFAEEWVGTEAAVDAFLETIDPSVRITRTVRDGQHYVTLQTVTPESGGVTEVPVDSYEMSTEYETVDVWGNPKIQAGTLLNQTTQIRQHEDCVAKFRRFCETRLRDLYNGYATVDVEASGSATVTEGKGPTPLEKTGLYLPGTTTVNPTAAADFNYGDANANARVNNLVRYYWMMTMGTTRWPVRQITLSRRRTCSPNYAAQHVADGVEYIYTRSALIYYFNIPNGPGEIGQRLPLNPTNNAPYTQWAWKIRRQDTQQLPRTGRVEELIDWVFAAWTLEMYELIDYVP